MKTGPLPPTKTFSGDRLALTIAGVRLELLHTPGETNDGISVWLPDTRVLLTGDLFLKAFPNLYAIRGAAPRPVMAWVGSLTGLIALGAGHVVPGHTRPILGATSARDALTAYRDGIKSVFDQTLEGMRKGERPDELVANVKLPPHLAGSPYLQEYYGTVEWSVRAIYSDHLGGSTATPRTCSQYRRRNARRGSCRWPVACRRRCHAAGRHWPGGTSNGPPSLRTASWPWTAPTSRRNASRRRP